MKSIGTAIVMIVAIHLGAPETYAVDYRLQPGVRVRVQMAEQGSPSLATLVRASDSEIAYQTQSGAINTVPASALHSLEVSGGKRGHAGTGALIGGIAGLALGIAAVVDAQGDPWFEPTGGEAAAAILVTTGVGALSGTLVGAMIRTEQWTEVGPSSGLSAIRSGPTLQVGVAFPLR